MKYGKYEKAAPKEPGNGRTKMLALILSLVLLVGCVVGTTLAWLADKTESVNNVFTASNISVDLNEEKGTLSGANREFKMIPGHIIEKDPVVTVYADSEDCYLFIQVNENNNLADYIDYQIDLSIWTPVPGETNVYYKEVTNITADKSFTILGGKTQSYAGFDYTWAANHVLVRPDVEMADMEAAEQTTPSLSFTAYAVQLKQNNNDNFQPEEAWAIAKTLNP